jgi:hypothetical protein
LKIKKSSYINDTIIPFSLKYQIIIENIQELSEKNKIIFNNFKLKEKHVPVVIEYCETQGHVVRALKNIQALTIISEYTLTNHYKYYLI